MILYDYNSLRKYGQIMKGRIYRYPITGVPCSINIPSVRKYWLVENELMASKYTRNELTRKLFITQECRSTIAQVIAATVKNLFLLNIGLTFSFSIFMTGALHNTSDELSLNDVEITWYTSLSVLLEPLGSLCSGLVIDIFGRKLSMMVTCIPMMISWLLLPWANKFAFVLTNSIVSGYCSGFTRPPTNTYAGEICVPKLRGIMNAAGGIFYRIGLFVQFLMLAIIPWRTCALINAALPVLIFILLFFIPESPQWLLSKGKSKEATRALCWLRGWVSPSDVYEEMQGLIDYQNKTKKLSPYVEDQNRILKHDTELMPIQTENELLHTSIQRSSGEREGEDDICVKEDDICVNGGAMSADHDDTLLKRIKAFIMKETLHPLLFMIVHFFLFHSIAGTAMLSYYFRVCAYLHLPLETRYVTLINSLLGLASGILLLALISYLGKRLSLLISVAGTALCFGILGLLEIVNQDFSFRWFHIILLVGANVFSSFGVLPIPFFLLSEVFPYRTRGLASGIVYAISCIISFSFKQTFLMTENLIGIPGILLNYSICGIIGFLFLFYFMPETEGRTLVQIEEFFKTRYLATGEYRKVLKSQKQHIEDDKAED